MPVTARFSRKFYEQLGDDIVTELVDWLNSVDATYRSDLRDLNDANFARFEAKLDQRVSALDVRFSVLEGRMSTLEARMDARFAEFSDRITGQMAHLETRLMRWTLGLWTGTMLAFVAATIAILKSK